MTARAAAVAAASLLAVAALTGCGGEGDGAAKVDVKTFSFSPDPVRIEAGTTVTWTNRDQIDHTVTSGTRRHPDGRFDGKLPDAGARFRTTFDRPGTFRYFCRIHPGPGMEAVVIVR